MIKPTMLTLLLASAGPLAAAAPVFLGPAGLDPGGAEIPPPWQAISINDRLTPTRYRLLRVQGITAFEAQAQASMSLLGRPLPADTHATPILCWRWQIDAPLQSADMTRKAGDDYAARVYVALSIPSSQQSLGTRAKLRLARTVYGPQIPDAALNYVWDNRQPVGTLRPNAYTELTQMLVVNTGAAQAGRWVEVRRDLAADIARAFPTVDARPSLLAVASDTDNTGERARALFADFHLVARDQRCRFNPPE